MIKNYSLLGIVFIIIILTAMFVNDWDDNMTGKQIIETRVNIVDIKESECNFTLQQEWNLVSFYCLGMLNTRESVLSNLSGKYNSIFTYNNFDSNDPWKSYNPSIPNWTVQQLNYMDRISGYYIYMNTPSDFYFEGYMKYTIIPLNTGWNLIGYPRIIAQSPNDTFSDINYTIVKGYDAIQQQYLFYIPNHGGNTMNETKTYNAYWINSTATQTLILQVE